MRMPAARNKLTMRFSKCSGQAIEFNNLGWLHALLGDYEKAIDFYNKALEIFRKLGNQSRQGY